MRAHFDIWHHFTFYHVLYLLMFFIFKIGLVEILEIYIEHIYTSNGRCFAVSCLHVVTVIYLMHAACQYTSLLYCIRGVCIYIYVYMDTVSDFKLKFGYMVKFSG